MGNIITIIPAYEPDERLIDLLKDIVAKDAGTVVMVDDGSGPEYKDIFDKACETIGEQGILLTHEVNKGKGRALKTAFSYILENMGDDLVGVVTADSDGQHSVDCMGKVKEALLSSPDSLILGVRSFNKKEIPWKSYYGNKITMNFMSYVSGVTVSDTQTGLRGIPKAFMKDLLDTEGERFEFETRMLLETVDRYPIVEVPILTIYDSKENHSTHFNTFKDSFRIYKILAAKFVKYLIASVSSCVIDIILFAVFCHLLRGYFPVYYVAASTILARVISACCNFVMNYALVFRSSENKGKAAVKYVILAVLQMTASALIVTGLCKLFVSAPEVAVKIPVDLILFFLSYFIQRKFVFSSKKQ